MNDKLTGSAAAAREIENTLGLIGFDETIEAIILKHCPDDKAVGNLVKVCKATNHLCHALLISRENVTCQLIREIANASAVALAEYEKVKK